MQKNPTCRLGSIMAGEERQEGGVWVERALTHHVDGNAEPLTCVLLVQVGNQTGQPPSGSSLA